MLDQPQEYVESSIFTITHLQIARRCRSEQKVLYTIFLLLKRHCATETTQDKRASLGSTTETVLSEMNKYYKKARPASGMRGIKDLYDNAPAHKSKLVQKYLSNKTFKLCLTFPTPRIWHHVIFFLFPCLKKSLSVCKFNSRSALVSAVFQCLDHIPREGYKHAFIWTMDTKTKEVCCCSGSLLLKGAGQKICFKVSERNFKSMVSFIPEIPLYVVVRERERGEGV